MMSPKTSTVSFTKKHVTTSEVNATAVITHLLSTVFKSFFRLWHDVTLFGKVQLHFVLDWERRSWKQSRSPDSKLQWLMVSHLFTLYFLLMTCVEVFSGSVEDSLSASFVWSSCQEMIWQSDTSLKSHFCWPQVLDYCLTWLSCYSRNIQNLKVISCILMFENYLSRWVWETVTARNLETWIVNQQECKSKH